MEQRMARMARVAALAALAACAGVGTAWGGEPDAARQAAIVDMVRNTCTACHGAALEGGVGPALTAAALAERDPAALAATILNGVPDTPMMAFAGMFSADEAAWLAGRLKAGLTP